MNKQEIGHTFLKYFIASPRTFGVIFFVYPKKEKAMKRDPGPPLSRPLPICTYNAVPMVPVFTQYLYMYFGNFPALAANADQLNMSCLGQRVSVGRRIVLLTWFQFAVGIIVDSRDVV
jgi:hypothetical protein